MPVVVLQFASYGMQGEVPVSQDSQYRLLVFARPAAATASRRAGRALRILSPPRIAGMVCIERFIGPPQPSHQRRFSQYAVILRLDLLLVGADCGARTRRIGLQEDFRESLQVCGVFVERAKATSGNPLSDVCATPQVVLKRPTALVGAAKCRRNSFFESRKALCFRLNASGKGDGGIEGRMD